MNVPNNNLRVMVWDLGPKAPKLPTKPAAPSGHKPGSPEEMMAESDFRAALSLFERDRDDFVRLKRDYDSWQHINGGPYQIEMWSANAREALARDSERYVRVLAKGVKPGARHAENLRRLEAEQNELNEMRDRDPQFGLKGAAA